MIQPLPESAWNNRTLIRTLSQELDLLKNSVYTSEWDAQEAISILDSLLCDLQRLQASPKPPS